MKNVDCEFNRTFHYNWKSELLSKVDDLSAGTVEIVTWEATDDIEWCPYEIGKNLI